MTCTCFHPAHGDMRLSSINCKSPPQGIAVVDQIGTGIAYLNNFKGFEIEICWPNIQKYS